MMKPNERQASKKLDERQAFWIRWGPALLMMALIFLFSSIPSKEMPSFGEFDLSFKKGGHMIGYALLAISYLHGLGSSRPKAWVLAWLMAVFYAITDEIHQSFVPGRGPWVVDVGIDAVGALIGLLIVRRSLAGRLAPRSERRTARSGHTQ